MQIHERELFSADHPNQIHVDCAVDLSTNLRIQGENQRNLRENIIIKLKVGHNRKLA